MTYLKSPGEPSRVRAGIYRRPQVEISNAPSHAFIYIPLQYKTEKKNPGILSIVGFYICSNIAWKRNGQVGAGNESPIIGKDG